MKSLHARYYLRSCAHIIVYHKIYLKFTFFFSLSEQNLLRNFYHLSHYNIIILFLFKFVFYSIGLQRIIKLASECMLMVVAEWRKELERKEISRTHTHTSYYTQYEIIFLMNNNNNSNNIILLYAREYIRKL